MHVVVISYPHLPTSYILSLFLSIKMGQIGKIYTHIFINRTHTYIQLLIVSSEDCLIVKNRFNLVLAFGKINPKNTILRLYDEWFIIFI